MSPARIEVTIEEVVLRGVPPERAREVVAELEATLARQARAALGSEPGPHLRRDRAESSRRMRRPVTGRADHGGPLGAALADAVWREVAGPAGPGRTDRGLSAGGGRR